MHKSIILVVILLFEAITGISLSQNLKPYFDKEEYKELLLISFRTTTNKKYYSKYYEPKHHKLIYQSKPVGLDNLWQLWVDTDKAVAVISIRGTTDKPESSLANFYAAMVPAKGKIKLSENKIFNYTLSEDSNAAVHIGWLISTAYLSKDILPKIDSLYKTGIKDYILVGHSQGGAITYLLTAYLYNLKKQGKLPNNIKFKTYCSAAPKPGNLNFAYSYEKITSGGWAFNIVNSADWVPQTPITIQTLEDINKPNPFVNAKSEIANMKFPYNLAAKHIYNQLDKPLRKAQSNYEKYLGKMTSKYVKKELNELIPPKEYFHSNDYVRTGATITLYPDKNYYEHFKKEKDSFFFNHGLEYYLYLIENYR